MDNRRVPHQHEHLRIPNGWKGQEQGLIVQLEHILDDIYNQLMRRVISVLGVKADDKGNVVLTKDDITAFGFIVNNLTSESTTDALSANQGRLLAQRERRINMDANTSIRITAPGRCSFLLMISGGTNANSKAAYICYAGTDAESYELTELKGSDYATVTAAANGITVANGAGIKYVDIVATTPSIVVTNI